MQSTYLLLDWRLTTIRSQGNATVTVPAQGFSETGLAKIFGDPNNLPSATPLPPTASQKPHSNRVRNGIIAGIVVGVTVLLTLACAAMWWFRKRLRGLILGDLSERSEIDGQGKTVSELPSKASLWELPEAMPAELWTPTEEEKKIETEEFKHETDSDREIGWRGDVEKGTEAGGEADPSEQKKRHSHLTWKDKTWISSMIETKECKDT